MGSICSNGETSQSVPQRESYTPSRLVRAISTPEDFVFSPGTFIQQNKNSFRKIYSLDNKIIGIGMYTEIRTCTHKQTGITRAVKIIHKVGIPDEVLEQRPLLHEVNILKNLDHPNILRIYEFFEDQYYYYIVMEYCSGGDLFDKVSSMQRFSEKQAAMVMKQIFSAVAYLHARNFVHRDLKPENILIDDSQHDEEGIFVKVIDFDTASYLNIKDQLRGSYGTIYYMAPEIFSGSYNHMCDLWSCGVILYILLSGSPPFVGENDDEITRNIKKGKVSFSDKVWSAVSDQAKDLIKKLLVKDPAQRINAIEAHTDPWLKQFSDLKSRKSSSLVLDKIKNFNKTSKLKDALHTFILTQVMTPSDVKDQQSVFRSIDVNGDGVISREELLDWCKNFMSEEEAEKNVDEIMHEIDSDRNGVIDYIEFLKASVDMKKLLTEQNLKNTFMMFDKDQNGTISTDELRSWISDGDLVDEEIIESFMKEIDQNGDGQIELKEFESLLLGTFGRKSSLSRLTDPATRLNTI